MLIVGFVGLLIAIYWVIALRRTLGRPADWQPPGTEQFPIRITRDRYLVACVLGIVGALGVSIFAFAYGLVVGS